MKAIEYKVSYEKMITRLPGMFAYLEADELGQFTLHKATDSPNGSYGKIVEDIKLPVSLKVDGETLLTGDSVYSFRTLITYYYQYRDVLDKNDPFRAFMEDGIGRVKVDDSITKNYPAAPEYVYLSNVTSLYGELVKMGKQCEFYQRYKEVEGKDKYLCCLCEKYENMGGDLFRDYIGELIDLANDRANKYYGYAVNNSMTLDFDVDLTSSYEDMGVLDCYVPQWLPYKQYYEGDKVYYEGKIWECTKDNTGDYNDTTEKVEFSKNSFKELTNAFPYNGNKVFDHERNVVKTITEIGNTWYDTYIERNSKKNVLCTVTKVNKDEHDTITSFEYTMSGGELDGETDTKLKDLRRMVSFLNESSIAENPNDDEDWLYYYRVGVVTNVKTITDEHGNIVSLSNAKEGKSVPAKTGDDLCAYGDVIESITPNQDDYTITFTYRLGAHLKSKEQPSTGTDEDGNPLYYWDNFERDKNETDSIQYTETYTYVEDSDLDKLIKGEIKVNKYKDDGEQYVVETVTFDNYVNGVYDKMLKYKKFEFVTVNNTLTYEKTISNQTANIVSIVSEFNKTLGNHEDFIEAELIRHEYFNGISYAPTKKIDVDVKRGTTSVFQKHIAFGEVKTLEDMVEYSNSSFFRMTEG